MKPLPTSIMALATFGLGLAVAGLWPAGFENAAPRQAGNLTPTPGASAKSSSQAAAPLTRLGRKAAAASRLGSMTASEARAELLKLPIPPAKADEEWWSALLQRWTRDNIPAAMAWLRKAGVGRTLAYDLALPALTTAALTDLPLALTAAGSWPYEMHMDLLRAAAGVNPESTVRFAAASRPRLEYGLSTAFSVWVEKEQTAALAWLLKDGKSAASALIPRAPDLYTAIPPEAWASLLSGLSRIERESLQSQRVTYEGWKDPLEVLSRLPGLKGAEHDAALKGIVGGLMIQGNLSQLTEVMGALQRGDREIAGWQLKDSLDALPPEIIARLSGLPFLTVDERLRLLQRTTGQKPAEILEELEELKKSDTQGAFKDQIRAATKNQWWFCLARGGADDFKAYGQAIREGRADPEFSLQLAQELSRDGMDDACRQLVENLPENQRAAPLAMQALMTGLKDPSADLSAITSDSLSPQARQEVLKEVFGGRSMSDPARMAQQAALIARLPAELRQAALNVGMNRASGSDYTAFAPVVKDLVANAKEWTPDLVRSVSAVAESVSRKDPTAGFAWADNVPEGAGRADVQHNVFGSVLSSNPIAASEWLTTQPPGLARDNLVRQLAEEIRESDPASAWQWAASTTTNLDSRRELLQQILPHWQAADPAAATEAAKNTEGLKH